MLLPWLMLFSLRPLKFNMPLRTMTSLDFRIEPADFRADGSDLRSVRHAVFVAEQKIPDGIEFDDIDPYCHHVIARDDQNQAIGTGRLTPERNIGRMAVMPEWRHRGVGRALLQALIDKAARLGWTEVTVHAQAAVTGFYQQFGFIRIGDGFIEADIPHQTMHLILQPPVAPDRPSLKARTRPVEPAELHSLQDTLNATAELIGQTGRQLCIYTRDLEYELYGRKEIVGGFKHLAINTRDSKAHIIVQDIPAARSRPHHPLVNLAQRLPSSFAFRMPVEAEDLQYPSAFIVNDRGGYLFRLSGDRYEGHWSPVMPEQHKQLFGLFDKMWQRSLPCPEFRTLGI
ncbi:MAG: GNAT family N-acetyltransferase [Gammaproteobacteria bacterium]